MAFTYQVATMGPGPTADRRAIVRAIEAAVQALGLAPADDLEIIRSAKDIKQRNSLVGIWLGRKGAAATAGDLRLLDAVLDAGATVIPVVDSLKDFHKKVPSALAELNGVEREPRINIVQAALRLLGLTRAQRQAFITYKRTDSTGVAIQIFDGLSQRGFHAFLDTASIEVGEVFQSVLWDRISDADVHVFLDTPNALSSTWIVQELARVNALGLGVVQIVWPGHPPTPGTEFSLLSRQVLTAADFVNGDTSVNGRLREPVVREILRTVEQSRISSIGFRRIKVIGELTDQATSHKLGVVLQPAGYAELRKKRTCVGLAFPIVGLPDAWTIHELETKWKKYRKRWRTDEHVKVVFDGLGMRPERKTHLVWLNDSLQLKTSTLEELPAWWDQLNGAAT